MISKVFKVIWIVSLLVMTVALVYCYAAWPLQLSLTDREPVELIGKSTLFYLTLTTLGFFNMLAFIWPKLNPASHLLAWFYGALACLHFFLLSGTIFITIFNSLEKYNYAYIGPVLYGSIGLLGAWILSLPFVLLFGKKTATE